MSNLMKNLEVTYSFLNRYKESHRKYHNLAHIEDCLWKFDLIRHLLHKPDLVEIALIAHDLVYDPRSKLNEKQSATLITDHMRSRRDIWTQTDIFFVDQLIMATQHNWPYPLGHDVAYMVDIDLSSLGSSRAEFFEGGRNIRDEYHFVPIYEFCQARAKFLKDLLTRPSIFQTTVFNRLFELKARENIKEAIGYLEKGEDKHYV